MNQKSTNVALEQETKSEPIPVNVADWFISILIASIPVVGIVMLCVWAFSDQFQESKENWAIAMLIWWVIIIVAFIIFLVFFGGTDWMRDAGL